MSEIAQLLLPALRWDMKEGYEPQRAMIDRAIDAGVGGFILFGGPEAEVRSLTRELAGRSQIPLLIGADLERGAGQQFSGKTGLPPLAALGSLGDLDAIAGAARITALEAQSLGVNWVYGPVCDLDVEPENPIVGTRAFGGDLGQLSQSVSAWIDACQAEGVLACAKHFPGHGRTTGDSHAELPTVTASRDTLDKTDLVPFRAAIAAGVASIMSAHVAFPALDPSGAPATLSPAILHDLLRAELGFEGLVVTDALIMEGVLGDGGEQGAVVRALQAGCDLLLYPADLAGVERAIASALADGRIDARRISESLERRSRWAEWACRSSEVPASPADVAFGADVADRSVHALRGSLPELRGHVEVMVIDDDLGGPYPPPSRQPFLDELRQAGIDVEEREDASGRAGSTAVIALFGDIRAWKGRPGYSEASRAALVRALDSAVAAGQSGVVVQFSHPRLATIIGSGATVVCAWGGEEVMQRAAARVLTGKRGAQAAA